MNDTEPNDPKPRSRLSASHVAVGRQGIYVKYSVEYSKCCALNGILVSRSRGARGLDTNRDGGPRGILKGPKGALEGFRRGPKGDLEGPKRGPRGTQKGLRWLESASSRYWGHSGTLTTRQLDVRGKLPTNRSEFSSI
eukprot:5253418-Pyramimonas_sp.AAC.2